MKKRYDENRVDFSLKEGDWVLIALTDAERDKFPVRKLAPRWSRPATVTRVLSNGVTYEVKREDGVVAKVHISRLLPLREPLWSVESPQTQEAQEEEVANKAPAVESAADDESDDDVVKVSWWWNLRPESGRALVPKAPRIEQPRAETGQTDGSRPLPPAENVVGQPPPTETRRDLGVRSAFSDEPVVDRASSSSGIYDSPTAIPSDVEFLGPMDAEYNDTPPSPLERYIVKRLIKQRFWRDDPEPLIRVEWEGFPSPRDQTWERRSTLLEDVPDLIQEFDETRSRRRRGREQVMSVTRTSQL